jgi:hypothetical protein
LVLSKDIFSKQTRESKLKSQLDSVVIQEESILVQFTHCGEIHSKLNISCQSVIGQLRSGVMSLDSQSCKPDIIQPILQMVAGHQIVAVFSI